MPSAFQDAKTRNTVANVQKHQRNEGDNFYAVGRLPEQELSKQNSGSLAPCGTPGEAEPQFRAEEIIMGP